MTQHFKTASNNHETRPVPREPQGSRCFPSRFFASRSRFCRPNSNHVFVSGTITFGTPIADDGTFYVRWHDCNDNGTSDLFLVIDDMAISSVVPEPTVASLSQLGLGALVGVRARREEDEPQFPKAIIQSPNRPLPWRRAVCFLHRITRRAKFASCVNWSAVTTDASGRSFAGLPSTASRSRVVKQSCPPKQGQQFRLPGFPPQPRDATCLSAKADDYWPMSLKSACGSVPCETRKPKGTPAVTSLVWIGVQAKVRLVVFKRTTCPLLSAVPLMVKFPSP